MCPPQVWLPPPPHQQDFPSATSVLTGSSHYFCLQRIFPPFHFVSTLRTGESTWNSKTVCLFVFVCIHTATPPIVVTFTFFPSIAVTPNTLNDLNNCKMLWFRFHLRNKNVTSERRVHLLSYSHCCWCTIISSKCSKWKAITACQIPSQRESFHYVWACAAGIQRPCFCRWKLLCHPRTPDNSSLFRSLSLSSFYSLQ